MSLKDYYAILGLPRGSSLTEIRIAYRKLAAVYHPDKFASASSEEGKESPSRMIELNEAMAVLGNVGRRSAYDRELKLIRPATTRQPIAASDPVRSTDAPLSDRRADPIQAPTLEERVRSMRVRLHGIPLRWRDVRIPQWAWAIESSDGQVLIAHQHNDTFDVSGADALMEAVDDILAERKKVLHTPSLIVLLTWRTLREGKNVMSKLETLTKQKRGWFQKGPLILFYDGSAGRILRFGEVPKDSISGQVMNVLLHP